MNARYIRCANGPRLAAMPKEQYFSRDFVRAFQNTSNEPMLEHTMRSARLHKKGTLRDGRHAAFAFHAGT